MPAISSTRKAGRRYLCLTAFLAGCQAAPGQVAGPSQLKFEVTDVSNPSHVSSAIVQNGAQIDFPMAFNIAVRVVGSDPAGTSNVRFRTTAYTSECNGAPVPEPYRTKLIVFPESVTAPPPAQTRLGYRLPLSTLTLMELGLCDPEAPTPGSFHILATTDHDGHVGSAADLTIRIGNQMAAPSPSFDGRYQGSVQVTGVGSGGDRRWCETNRQLSLQVTNHSFTYIQPHPNAPQIASVDARTATYTGTISSEGSITGTSDVNGTIEGRLTGSHMTGTMGGYGCSYSFSADRL
jgi:hypothetical protein